MHRRKRRGFDQVSPKGDRLFLSIQFIFYYYYYYPALPLPGHRKAIELVLSIVTRVLYSHIVLYPRFLLRDRNYSFRGWTSGPPPFPFLFFNFLTVRGLRTPREEPLWPTFRDTYAYYLMRTGVRNNDP